MSSTSNVQNLLVNVFRPTYRYDTGTGAFTPSLSMSNISDLTVGRIQTGALAVTDSNINTFLGCNAGFLAVNSASNVGIGYSALAGAVNASNNVAIGYQSLDGVSNASSNVAIGAGTDISGLGDRNVLLGPNVTLGSGSNNILIGTNIARGTISNQLQIGRLLYGDLCSGFLGVNISNPVAAFDISGITLFRDKVGIQINSNPDYSLHVAGSIYATDRFLGSNGSAAAPLYSFRNTPASGMYVATDACYGTGAFGIAVQGNPAAVFASNRTYFFSSLDVCGTFSARNVVLDAVSVANGTAAAPSVTFSNNPTTGLFLDQSGTLGFTAGGRRGMQVFFNGDVSLGRLIAGQVIGSGFDISGGTISNSGANFASNFRGSNGSVSIPTYSFVSDPSTGIHLGAGGSYLAFDVSGVQRMCISAGGFVGIGTTVPTATLEVNGLTRIRGTAGTDVLQFTDPNTLFSTDRELTTRRWGVSLTPTTSGTAGGDVVFSSYLTNQAGPTYTLPWLTRTAILVLQRSTGNVGIGTLNPGYPLDVAGTARSDNFLGVPGGPSRPAYAFTTDPSSGLDLVGTSYLAFETGGIQRMCLSGGLLGIGTPAPMSTLDLSDGTLSIRRRFGTSGVTNNTASIEVGGGYTNLAAGGIPAVAFQFQNGGFRHFLRTRHNATLNPDQNNAIDFFLNTGIGDISSSAPGVFNTNAMSVTAAGVGIGTSAPTTALDISTGATVGLTIRQGGTQAGVGLQVTNGVRSLDLGVASTAGAWAANSVSGDAVLRTTAAGRILLNANGTGANAALAVVGDNVGIGTITPATTLDISVAVPTLRISSGSDASGLASIELGGGATISGLSTARPAISFQRRDTGGFRHFLVSGHTGGLGNNANYVQLWLNDSTTAGGSVAPNNGSKLSVAFTAGGVGIGTSVPAGTDSLDVSGRAFFQRTVSGNTNLIILADSSYGSASSAARIGLALNGSATGGDGGCDFSINTYTNAGAQLVTPAFTLQRATGRVGIGTSNPAHSLDVYASGTGVSNTIRVGAGIGASSANVARMRFSIAASSSAIVDTDIWSDQRAAANNFGLTFGGYNDLSLVRMDMGNSRVGIRTMEPRTVLDISGQGAAILVGAVTSGGTDGLLVQGYSNAGYIRPQASGSALYLGASNTSSVVITTTGMSVGSSGIPNSLYALDVCGDIRISGTNAYKAGGTAWTTTSDQRLKQNIQPADTSLCYSIVKNLPLKRFTWDVSYLPQIKDKRVVGWIAQEVETVFPQAVERVKDFGLEDLRYLDSDQIYKTMYGALEKVIADKETLEAKVAAQETLLQSVLARLATLEASLGSS